MFWIRCRSTIRTGLTPMNRAAGQSRSRSDVDSDHTTRAPNIQPNAVSTRIRIRQSPP